MTTNVFMNSDQRLLRDIENNNVEMKDFKNLTKLKTGTYGKIYKAEYRKTKKIYALKLVLIEHKDIVEQGFPIASKLNHENIMKTYGYFLYPSVGKEYIVSILEYIDGINLMTYYKNNPRQDIINNLPDIILQILDGLKYLNDNTIIHRDLKLENILVNKEGNVKIVDNDFVIAVDKVLPDDVCGTLYYIPPEVFKKKKYNTQFDMWSLGVMIYFLLTGQYPFDGDDREDLKDAILYEKADLDNLPILYRRLIRGLFQRNSELRLDPEGAAKIVYKF